MNTNTLVIGLITAAGLAFIPASIAKQKGYSFGIWWFYGWMLFIVAIIHVAVIPNKNASQTVYIPTDIPSPSPVSNRSTIDELKKYKELLDSGVITQEEFAAKKEQLLKLL